MNVMRMPLFLSAAIVISGLLVASPEMGSTQESVLYSFSGAANNPGGYNPNTILTIDTAGNLHGATTRSARPGSYGVVFKLTQVSPGTWEETVLHTFTGKPAGGVGEDGSGPSMWGGVILDAQGDRFGTTVQGGDYGNGTVFEVSPAAGGGWTEKVLFSFSGNGIGGASPEAGVIADANGNLYGTTSTGGANGGGAVFELKAGPNGWTFEELFSFSTTDAIYDTNETGANPYAPLTFDRDGNLYGTTSIGGANGGGVVFRLSPVNGKWTETVLHNFAAGNPYGASDGANPWGPLTWDPSGNLYGTTQDGGAYGLGTVYELTPQSGGNWAETLVYQFLPWGVSSLGVPLGGVIFDATGSLYATANRGGPGDYGGIFKLTRVAGNWTESVLHSFNPTGGDGVYAYGPLVVDGQGDLYAATSNGGAWWDGEITQGGTIVEMASAATVVATPVISPGQGTYGSPQEVTIVDSTPGTEIYYTTDGDQPNASFTLYSGPFTVTASGLVKAVAYNAEGFHSTTATARYTIQ